MASDRKTLGQVLKETANREAATVKYDVKVRFDGRDYSLINITNYLEPWHDCEAYETERREHQVYPAW